MKKMNSLTLNGTKYDRFAGDVESVNGQTGTVVLNAEDVGALPDTTQIPVVPAALPNPYKLTFTGAVEAEYDGSEAVSVEIPDASDIELDTTLSVEGKAADAKAVGDALAGKQPSGNYVKTVNGEAPDENGNVEVEGGSVTDEQVASAVEAWLDEHPEATTTVQDGSVTPAKTTFVELKQGVPYEGVPIAKPPVTWNTEDAWLRWGNATVVGNLSDGKTEGNGLCWTYRPMMFKGTIYVRDLTNQTFTGGSTTVGDYMIIADSEDALDNPSYDTLSALKYSEKTDVFVIDGVASQAFVVKTDGTYEQHTAHIAAPSITDGYGVVSYAKFEIPEGKVGWLCAKHLYSADTKANVCLWLEGWNAVFSYDFKEDMLENLNISVTGELTGAELLEVTDEYKYGFTRSVVNSEYFKMSLKEIIDSLLPITTKFQTIGKSLWVGGDSLHAYSGGNGFNRGGFVTNYNNHLGFKTVDNVGYAGSTWSGTDGGGGIKRVTDLVAAGKPYDVFILAWGTNEDTGGNGTIDDVASNASGCTMVAAMKWCITQLRTTFRYSAIGVIIPPPKGTNEGMKEKGDLMVQVCELLHVPYVDMREYLSMDDMSSDGVHLGYGADKYGAVEAKLILDICPYGEPLS